MPRRNEATLLSAGLVGSGALIVHVVDGETPAANLPQRTVVLIMVRGLFIAVKTIGIGRRGLLMFAFGAREGADVILVDSMALHAVSTFSWSPFTLRWTLGCEDAGNKVSRRGGWSSHHEMVLDSRPCPTMDQVLLYKDYLTVCFSSLCI